MEINEKLKNFFKAKGISNKVIHEKTGYSEMMVSRYLKNSKPNYDFLRAILKTWPDLDLNYLFKDDNLVNEEAERYTIYTESLIMKIERIEKDLISLKNAIDPNLAQKQL